MSRRREARLAVFVPPLLASPVLAARLGLRTRGMDAVSFDGPRVAEPESKSHARILGLLWFRHSQARSRLLDALFISGNGKCGGVATCYRSSIYLVAADDALSVGACAPSSSLNSFSIFIFSLRPFFLVSGLSGLPQHLSLRIHGLLYSHRHYHHMHIHTTATAIMSYDYAMTLCLSISADTAMLFSCFYDPTTSPRFAFA
jgi:hypothetical protein